MCVMFDTCLSCMHMCYDLNICKYIHKFVNRPVEDFRYPSLSLSNILLKPGLPPGPELITSASAITHSAEIAGTDHSYKPCLLEY